MNEMTKPPLRSEPHPISGVLYTGIGDGMVRVEDKAKGKYGVFKWDGTWIEGDLTYADPHLLIFVGGPDLPESYDIPYPMMPPLMEDVEAFRQSPFHFPEPSESRCVYERKHNALCALPNGLSVTCDRPWVPEHRQHDPQ